MGLGIPVVIAAERNVIRRPGWQRLLERALDGLTDRYLVNSAAIVDELTAQGGLSRGKMQVVHNGIDLGALPAFDPDRRRARAALGFDPARRLIAQVGRLEPQKDYPRISPRRRASRHVSRTSTSSSGDGRCGGAEARPRGSDR